MLRFQKLLMFQDDDGYTAMHRAAYAAQLAVVEYLLEFEERVDMPELAQLQVFSSYISSSERLSLYSKL